MHSESIIFFMLSIKKTDAFALLGSTHSNDSSLRVNIKSELDRGTEQPRGAGREECVCECGRVCV